MTHLTLRSLYQSGAISLLHDYRAGHCGSLVPDYTAVYRDGVATGAVDCAFRTGHGFETNHDGAATPLSQGYIRIADDPVWTPPADGMCIIASYMQSDDTSSCQIIGQGGDSRTNTSWALRRRSGNIDFVVSDGAGLTTFSYAIASVPGQIETVGVRYEGGTVGNNCTIGRTVAGVTTTSTGNMDRVPQDVAQPVSICSYSTNAQFPFVGTMRYVCVIRGKQTLLLINALQAEIEAFKWNSAIETFSHSYLVAARETNYVSRFGVDRTVAAAGDGTVDYTRIANSNWHARILDGVNPSTYIVGQHHIGSYGALGSTHKSLVCTDNSKGNVVYMPRLPYWGGSDTEAAYGTWDWWYWFKDPKTSPPQFWVVASTPDLLGNGYLITTTATGALQLVRMPGATVLATGAADDVTSAWYRLRVTRSALGVWNVYVNNGTLAGWRRAIGPVTDNTHIVSDYVVFYLESTGRVGIGNNEGNGVFSKWVGDVAPI